MKNSAIWATVFALSSALNGCTVTHYDNPQPQTPAPAPPPPPPPPPAYTPPPPATPPTYTPPPATPPQTGWRKLGARTVDAGVDHDSINLSQKDAFTALQVRANNAPIDLYELTVTFQDGTTYAPKVQQNLPPGSSSRSIDLPGRQRAIQKVEFRYRNVNGSAGRRAELELWGR